MKKTLLLLIILTLGYTLRLRITLSNNYANELHISSNSGDTIIFQNNTDYNTKQTFIYPVSEGETLHIQVKGATIVRHFAIYNILRYFREYKPFSVDNQTSTSFSIDTSSPIIYDKKPSENPIQNYFRNSFLDKGGNLIAIGVEIISNREGNTELKKNGYFGENR